MNHFSINLISQYSICALHLGTVQDVIKGIVSGQLKHRRFDASDYQSGFEIGSAQNFEALGEAMLVNNRLFSTSTDPKSHDYGHVVSGPEFVTSGIFLIPKSAKPSFHLSMNTSCGMNLYDLYARVYQTIKKPLAFSGFIKFSQFHANHIEKAPIEGLNIFEHPKVYYTQPQIKRKGEYGFVIGAITDYHDKTLEDINRKLEVVLYKNPNEQGSVLSYHAHVLTLNRHLVCEDQITQDTVNECLHLFCEDTQVLNAELNIFTIEDLKGVIT